MQAETSDRYGFSDPEEQTRLNPDLPPGVQRLAQFGSRGFTVEVTRVLTYPDGREERELHATTYLPEPRIIEHGPGAPPTPDPTPSPTRDRESL